MIEEPKINEIVWFMANGVAKNGAVERDSPIIADSSYYCVAVDKHIPYLLTKHEMFHTREEAESCVAPIAEKGVKRGKTRK